MYIPNAYRETDTATLVAFMRVHSFITLVSTLEGAPLASHIPVALSVREDVVTITGHLARANPQWAAFGAAESLAIFTGPHAYVSPALYEKRESVPTWNYIAVHAYGTPRPIHADADAPGLEAGMRELIGAYEAAYQTHWESLPVKFREGMLRGVVGFEMVVTRLEGKYKLSQNRSAADRHSVAAHLLEQEDQAAYHTGLAMRRTLETETQE
jgi:transcriptional regulator